MEYGKPALTLAEQAALLRRRGMEGNAADLERRLGRVNYYRLAAYWHPFRRPDSDDFRPGTTIDAVWERYIFDRRLRLLVLDAVERFEVFMRTRLAYELGLETGPFGWREAPHLFRYSPRERSRLFHDALKELNRSRDEFMRHFREKYGDSHDVPPIWVAVETLSFGVVVRMYRGSPFTVQERVAETLGIPPKVLESWLLALNSVRNICAHHGRLWNRVLSIQPLIPRLHHDREWHEPVAVPNERIFGCLTILAYVLRRIAPRSEWPRRVAQLHEHHPEVPLVSMGFPDRWRESPLWNRLL